MADKAIDRGQSPAPIDSRFKAAFELQLSHAQDFTIKAGPNLEYSWQVHSKVLIEQSGFFEALLRNDMTEKANNEVKLQEDDPIAISRLIIWLYYHRFAFDGTGSDRDLPIISMLKDNSEVLEQIKLPTAAGAVAIYKADVYITLYLLADAYGDPSLRTEIVKILTVLVDSNNELFWELQAYVNITELGCEDLHDILKTARSKNLITLRKGDRFRAYLEANPDFYFTMFTQYANDNDCLKPALDTAKSALEASQAALGAEVKTSEDMKARWDHSKANCVEWIEIAKKLKAKVQKLDEADEERAREKRHTAVRMQEKRRTGDNGFQYTADGRPVCNRCDLAGHIAKDCPR